jgi:hypothetical protein
LGALHYLWSAMHRASQLRPCIMLTVPFAARDACTLVAHVCAHVSSPSNGCDAGGLWRCARGMHDPRQHTLLAHTNSTHDTRHTKPIVTEKRKGVRRLLPVLTLFLFLILQYMHALRHTVVTRSLASLGCAHTRACTRSTRMNAAFARCATRAQRRAARQTVNTRATCRHVLSVCVHFLYPPLLYGHRPVWCDCCQEKIACRQAIAHAAKSARALALSHQGEIGASAHTTCRRHRCAAHHTAQVRQPPLDTCALFQNCSRGPSHPWRPPRRPLPLSTAEICSRV